MTPGPPLVIAHRGGSPSDRENTAAAFQHSLALGVDALECDVRRTVDGILVLIHDATVRLSGRRIAVRDATFSRLHDTMPWLLTLSEFLDTFGHRTTLINVDLKAPGYESETLGMLEHTALVDRTLISSTSIRSLSKLAGLDPRLQLGLSRGHSAARFHLRPVPAVVATWLRVTLPEWLPWQLRLSRVRAAMLQHSVVTGRLVADLHRHGYRVFAWTVDDPREAQRLGAIQVDGIATNLPARVIPALPARPARAGG
jgi:glycerophosphoryl diester phosphodiesterase